MPRRIMHHPAETIVHRTEATAKEGNRRMHNLRPRTMPQVMHHRDAEGTEGERRSRRRSSRQVRLSQVRRRVTINHRAAAIAEGSLRFMGREEARSSSLSPLTRDTPLSCFWGGEPFGFVHLASSLCFTAASV